MHQLTKEQVKIRERRVQEMSRELSHWKSLHQSFVDSITLDCDSKEQVQELEQCIQQLNTKIQQTTMVV
jgi:predicted RNase H-like nuclease (RuvC/YqgF family)